MLQNVLQFKLVLLQLYLKPKVKYQTCSSLYTQGSDSIPPCMSKCASTSTKADHWSSSSNHSHPGQDKHRCVIISQCQSPLSEASRRLTNTWFNYLTLQSSVKLSTCDQWNPFVVKPSSTIGWQVWSSEIGHRSISGVISYIGFFSYFGQRVSFLLAPSARKKWALGVAGFTVLLSVSLET